MIRKISVIGLIPFISATVYAEGLPVIRPEPVLPGITLRTNNIYLIENHSTAYNIWHALDIKGATLIHIDTHDDCRHIPDEKITNLDKLKTEKNYQEIFNKSDIELSFRYQLKPDKFLFDLGNFIYPCIIDGTVSRLFWVVPNKELDSNTRLILQTHLQEALKLKPLLIKEQTDTSFSFLLQNCTITITTLDGLPRITGKSLLDIDTDFFVFQNALSENHIRGSLSWDPPTVCAFLNRRVRNPLVTTISSSVSGGYLPVAFRFLSDAIFEYFANGMYPDDAVKLLDGVCTMLSLPTSLTEPYKPRSATFSPAYEHFSGLFLVANGKETNAIKKIELATSMNPAYAKAMLDLAEAFISMGRLQRAHEMIDLFEKFSGGETSQSAAIRVRLLINEKAFQKADTLCRKLVDWDRSPYFLMLHAGLMVEQGRASEATVIYQEIIKSHPDNASAYYNMGLLLANQGNIDQAIEHYKMAIRLKPDLSAANENLGYILINAGKYQEAVACLKAAIISNPFNVSSLNNLGLTYAKLEIFSNAVACYNTALKLTPDRPEIHANLAAALINAGKLTEGIEQCRKALSLKPDWPAVINLMNEAKKKSF